MIDINPNYLQGPDATNDTVQGDTAVVESALFNLLNTTPGENSVIFNADVGSFWRQYLQEPICDATAAKIQIEILESIEKWLPNVELFRASSNVIADMNLPGYRVNITYMSPVISELQTVNFAIPI